MISSRLSGSMASILEVTVAIATLVCSSLLVFVIGTCIPESKSDLLGQLLAIPILL